MTDPRDAPVDLEQLRAHEADYEADHESDWMAAPERWRARCWAAWWAVMGLIRHWVG